MNYFNADGNGRFHVWQRGKMYFEICLNAWYKKNKYNFIAADGIHEAEIDLNGEVRLKMKDVKDVEYSYTHYILEHGLSSLCKKCKRCNAG